MYKNQLQEFAQQSCINLPSYSCVREGPDHAPRFKARVSFNGEVFESPKFCSTLRQAEHVAAELALATLSKRGPSRALAAKVLDETGVYKNLLQEAAHIAGMKLPVYTTVRAGPGYAPVFTCTVELAGMTFPGEPAKTKKQAQKSAAMVAWFALKELSQECSSSYHLSDLGRKDEQEQATIARYLSTIKLPETRRRDKGKTEREFSPVIRNAIPNRFTRPAHRIPHQQYAFSCSSPEIAMYQTWHQGTSQQLSHLLALPSASTSIPRPRLFPFIQSIFRPDIGSLFWAVEQEAAPLAPGMGPFFYLSNEFLPLPDRNDFHVTIEEIEEDNKVQEERLNKNINTACWKDDFLSAVPGNSPTDSSKGLRFNNSSSLGPQVLQKKTGDKKDDSNEMRKSSQPEAHQNEGFHWLPSGFLSNLDIVREAEQTRLQPENQSSRGSLWSDDQCWLYPTTSSPRTHMMRSVAFPVVSCASSSATFKSEFSNSSLPASTPKAAGFTHMTSTRPHLEGMKRSMRMPCASHMAPAVQIRSVMPVCSSPVGRILPPNVEGTSSRDEKKTPEETGKQNISDSSSEFCRLQI